MDGGGALEPWLGSVRGEKVAQLHMTKYEQRGLILLPTYFMDEWVQVHWRCVGREGYLSIFCVRTADTRSKREPRSFIGYRWDRNHLSRMWALSCVANKCPWALGVIKLLASIKSYHSCPFRWKLSLFLVLWHCPFLDHPWSSLQYSVFVTRCVCNQNGAAGKVPVSTSCRSWLRSWEPSYTKLWTA